MRSCGKANVRRLIVLIPLALVLLMAISLATRKTPVYYLELTDQKTKEMLFSQQVQCGDALELMLTHSFEHVPWNEYYRIQDDGTFLLERIEVGGYGAGIPAEMDVPTYVGDDGLVHMDGINSVFPDFRWISSQKNMHALLLNGEEIFEFSQIPNHSFVLCEVIIR